MLRTRVYTDVWPYACCEACTRVYTDVWGALGGALDAGIRFGTGLRLKEVRVRVTCFVVTADIIRVRVRVS